METTEISEVFESNPVKSGLVRKFNYMTVDNSWNSRGLLEQFSEEHGDTMYYCAKSSRPLFFTTKNGSKILLESCGICAETNKLLHIDYLWLSNDMAKMSFPIFMEGAMSIEAKNAPLTQQELFDIQKLYGI